MYYYICIDYNDRIDYIHVNGHGSTNIKNVLFKYYNNNDICEKLLNIGCLLKLGYTIDETIKFRKTVGRCKFIKSDSYCLEDFVNNLYHNNYIYIWKNNNWYEVVDDILSLIKIQKVSFTEKMFLNELYGSMNPLREQPIRLYSEELSRRITESARMNVIEISNLIRQGVIDLKVSPL